MKTSEMGKETSGSDQWGSTRLRKKEKENGTGMRETIEHDCCTLDTVHDLACSRKRARQGPPGAEGCQHAARQPARCDGSPAGHPKKSAEAWWERGASTSQRTSGEHAHRGARSTAHASGRTGRTQCGEWVCKRANEDGRPEKNARGRRQHLHAVPHNARQDPNPACSHVFAGRGLRLAKCKHTKKNTQNERVVN